MSKDCVQCNKVIVGKVIFSEADTGPYCKGCWDANVRSAGRVIIEALFGDEARPEYGAKDLADITED
jgi:hypothetical protein